jgi:hypothetical protein
MKYLKRLRFAPATPCTPARPRQQYLSRQRESPNGVPYAVIAERHSVMCDPFHRMRTRETNAGYVLTFS